MAHQEGWIDLYEILERGDAVPESLVMTVKNGKTEIGETFLHWYAIEGEPQVVAAIIGLGFDVNVQNEFGNTPLMECALLEKWEMFDLLRRNGARTDIRDNMGQDIFAFLQDRHEFKILDEVKRRVVCNM